jgi:hypothetical protein
MVTGFITRLILIHFLTTPAGRRLLLYVKQVMIYGIILLTDQTKSKCINTNANAVVQPMETAVKRKHGNEKKAMVHSNMFYSG